MVFIGRYLPGTARRARPLDGSVKSTIGPDWSCVATRLIISTWWGGSSGERQTQSARWIFKRDKGNGMGSSKFSTRGAALLWSHDTPRMLVIRAMPHLISRWNVTGSWCLIHWGRLDHYIMSRPCGSQRWMLFSAQLLSVPNRNTVITQTTLWICIISKFQNGQKSQWTQVKEIYATGCFLIKDRIFFSLNDPTTSSN